MSDKSKQRCELEICKKCHEIADLAGKEVCYWCILEARTKGQDVYDLPENMRTSLESLIEEESDDPIS